MNYMVLWVDFTLTQTETKMQIIKSSTLKNGPMIQPTIDQHFFLWCWAGLRRMHEAETLGPWQ